MRYSIGIDSGSTMTKGVLYQIDANQESAEKGVLAKRFLCPTPARPQEAILQAWQHLSEGLVLKPYLTLTGYGRDLVDFADKKVTEISCHGLGARYLCPSAMTVIDIGGQDSKVIRLDKDGNLTDFLMNDKCAAGTGRFLEVIARTLGVTLQMLDDTTRGVAPHPISSMCTVFAESEVISLRSAGIPQAEILSGILSSIAKRSANFAGRLGIEQQIFFTGGVSHSEEFRQRLSDALGYPVSTHGDAQFAGAIGAAIIGARRLQRQEKV